MNAHVELGLITMCGLGAVAVGIAIHDTVTIVGATGLLALIGLAWWVLSKTPRL